MVVWEGTSHNCEKSPAGADGSSFSGRRRGGRRLLRARRRTGHEDRDDNTEPEKRRLRFHF
jgi:hypothetical protein